jgi:hypothetical protein
LPPSISSGVYRLIPALSALALNHKRQGYVVGHVDG